MAKNRYSYLLPIISLTLDLLLINVIVVFVNDINYLNILFVSFSNLFWILSTQLTKYYKVNRQTSIYRVFSLIAQQSIIYGLGFFSYFAVFREGDVVDNQFKILISTLVAITLIKLFIFYALKWYRKEGMNYRKVVVIGFDDNAQKIIKIFNKKTDLGYRYQGYFSNKKSTKKDYLGSFQNSLDYLKTNSVDEVFCSVASLKKSEIKTINKIANQYEIAVKLIPEINEIYSKSNKAEYYDNTLILSVKKLPLEIKANRIVKRVFDIVFSILVLIFIMSWLTPILGILIKLKSKGSVFFKQEREGLKGHKFTCFKFRSMKLNNLSDKIHAQENDDRVTKIGAFMRRTSLDEMPQFYNVLFGDMSVVGPRPHMENLAVEYQKDIDNYMERHSVKPGITGLAQVSGYRGEVKKHSDIKNRVRLDIFYIENWSILLDIKIIVNTVFNVLKGEEKAY